MEMELYFKSQFLDWRAPEEALILDADGAARARRIVLWES
jgi:hypothetical protein